MDEPSQPEKRNGGVNFDARKGRNKVISDLLDDLKFCMQNYFYDGQYKTLETLHSFCAPYESDDKVKKVVELLNRVRIAKQIFDMNPRQTDMNIFLFPLGELTQAVLFTYKEQIQQSAKTEDDDVDLGDDD